MRKQGWHCLVLLFYLITRQARLHAQSLTLNSLRINSAFGWRTHPVTGQPAYHADIDLFARNEPVLSILDGRVKETGDDPFLGRYVRIDHGELQSIYGHLSIILVSAGDQVSAGDVIGITGNTGRTTGEHLHFAILFRGHYLPLLKFLAGLFLKPPWPQNQ
jgi:murein DD-endopeptidase MepM/ murein hydrolase activator NlpD